MTKFKFMIEIATDIVIEQIDYNVIQKHIKGDVEEAMRNYGLDVLNVECIKEMNNYQNIPTEDWLKYPETKPEESGYYLTTYLSGNLYYKCIYWDNKNQEWIWKKPFEVGCFVKKTGSKHYDDCLGKLKELYNITTC